MMLWQFDKEGKTNLQPACNLPTMAFTSGTDKTQHRMTQLDCSTAHKILGAQTTPSLQTQSALNTLEIKKKRYTDQLLTSTLTKLERYKAHHAVFIPAMTYTFPVMHHTKANLDKLQTSSTTLTLLKLGFNRHTSHLVVYGSNDFLGLGLKSLYVEQ